MANEDLNKIFIGIKRSVTENKEEKWYEYFFVIITNLFLLYIANNLIYWNLSFIANSFSDVLWAINLSLIVSIVANVSFILFDPPWFKIVSKIIMGFTALVAAFTLLTVFPFVINHFILLLGLKIVLIIGIIAFIGSIIFLFIKMVYLVATT